MKNTQSEEISEDVYENLLIEELKDEIVRQSILLKL